MKHPNIEFLTIEIVRLIGDATQDRFLTPSEVDELINNLKIRLDLCNEYQAKSR